MSKVMMGLPLVTWLALTILAVLNLLYAERPLLSPLAVCLMLALLVVLTLTTLFGFAEIKRETKVDKELGE